MRLTMEAQHTISNDLEISNRVFNLNRSITFASVLAKLVYTLRKRPGIFASQHVLEPIIPFRGFLVNISVHA